MLLHTCRLICIYIKQNVLVLGKKRRKHPLLIFSFLAPNLPATTPILVVTSKEASARHKLLCSLSPSSCHFSGRTSTLLRKSVCRLLTHPKARKEESARRKSSPCTFFFSCSKPASHNPCPCRDKQRGKRTSQAPLLLVSFLLPL